MPPSYSYRPFQPTLSREGLNCFGLTLESSTPGNILQGMVHSYLQISAQKPTPYPVIPDGMQAMFISPQETRIAGALTKACDVAILYPGEYFGIRFYPGALRHFFDLDLAEITDQFADRHYLSCPHFATLHHSIYQQPNFRARADVCEQWLLKRLKGNGGASQLEHALALIYQARGNLKVAQLARQVGRSSRHLNRLFQLHTGLGTKDFSQTIRFQHACRQLYSTPNNALNIALDSGFYDQAHLIKTYQKHLGMSPTEFTSRFMSDFYNR